HGRLRLPRLRGPGGARPLRLRRRLYERDLEPPHVRWKGDRHPPRAGRDRERLDLRRGRAWGALRGRAPPGPDLPALGRRLARAAPADLRGLLAQGGVGQRLERLVQRAELAGDRDEAFGVVEPAAQRLEL